MTKFFAWQRGLRGPAPVLFHQGLPINMETGIPRTDDLLMIVPVPVDTEADLDKLAEQFPLAA